MTVSAAAAGGTIRAASFAVHPRLVNLLSKALGQFLVCALVGLALRAAAFGDPAVHIDEAFYFLVGIQMHEGLLPYVDVWDRKPFGLFALYFLLAGISRSVLSYQIAAWLCASLTAFLVARISSRWTSPRTALLSAGAYHAGLVTFQGIGGQAPVFYNLLMVTSAWLILRSIPTLREGRVPAGTYAAMVLCGLAITIKQTTLFEAAALGLFATYLLWSSPQARLFVAARAAVFRLPRGRAVCCHRGVLPRAGRLAEVLACDGGE